ncbi:MAG: 2-isopropylmalate synthase, partial [Bdellovibrionales bacterium]
MATAQNDNNRVIIFDTTLRDGEQSPGCTMNNEQKLKVAHQLAAMNVDVIEAGFAAASPGDFDSIHTIAQEVKGSTICSLARAVEGDIRAAGEAIKPAESGRIHTFIATSPIHMQHKLMMTPDQVVERAVQAIKWAKEYTDDVEFSLEDGFRSEFDFICRVTEAAIRAGATTINIPDTVGYGDPEQYGEMFKNVIATVPNADQAVFSVHCHNDLGMATANSIAGVQNGARQIECTINGIGERAGNTALEEVVMAMKTRTDWGFYTNIDTTKIVPSSKLVSSVTGSPVQPNKSVVGVNAFAHESGIHQDGVLKHRETYEIMTAQDVGWSDNSLVMGKHSGRAAVFNKLEKLGFTVAPEDR